MKAESEVLVLSNPLVESLLETSECYSTTHSQHDILIS